MEGMYLLNSWGELEEFLVHLHVESVCGHSGGREKIIPQELWS